MVDDIRVKGGAWESFTAFAKLGVTSFGGPIAHIGYFRDEFVHRRKWLDDRAYADLVALCQFLPGPASSQTGFALGVMRGGLAGGIAAWVAFTLPSAVLLVLFAYGIAGLAGPEFDGLVHGLKLVAVAVVAQAILGMYRNLCPDRERATIAIAAAVIAALAPTVGGQIGAIAMGGAVWLLTGKDDDGEARGRQPAAAAAARPRWHFGHAASLVVFALLLFGAPVVVEVTRDPVLAFFDAFYRSGALVFGGGHVVLPLLRAEVVPTGWVDAETFLAGYGAAQAVPGPLFTFAAYLGVVNTGLPTGLGGAAVALVAIFLPGLLLVYGLLPAWGRIRGNRMARRALAGVNAGVVGLLAAALYNPLWTTTVERPVDFVLVIAGFALLTAWNWPSWSVVLLMAICGVLFGAFGWFG
jgi:chromate transporter